VLTLSSKRAIYFVIKRNDLILKKGEFMIYKRNHILGAVMAMQFLFTGCTSSSVSPNNNFIYQGIDFGSIQDENFKQGVRDACRTADGEYTKDHSKFKTNEDYRIGWEDGRLKCKGK